MQPNDCGAGRHSPQIDDDGDKVCTTCRLVLRVGPLGINGITLGGRIGYVSTLAVVDDDVYMSDEAPSVEVISIAERRKRATMKGRNVWAAQDKAWLRESA